jgi:hypothetical protein
VFGAESPFLEPAALRLFPSWNKFGRSLTWSIFFSHTIVPENDKKDLHAQEGALSNGVGSEFLSLPIEGHQPSPKRQTYREMGAQSVGLYPFRGGNG